MELDGVYQLAIALDSIEPPIWRRVEVPAALTLAELHRTIQVAMGWADSHLHEFVIADRRYGEPSTEWTSSDVVSERGVRLSDLDLQPNAHFTYIYDFGDGWEHDVRLEKITAPEPGARYPRCLAGARRCPPEDCGGAPGYENLLKAVRNPADPQHADLLDWVGGGLDPEEFDLDAVNRRLRRIR